MQESKHKTMRDLAALIMQGRWQAMAFVFGFALLSLAFAPLTLFSAAAVVLVTLVQGIREGLVNIIVASVVLSLTTALLFGSGIIGADFALKFWLPSWVFAAVLLFRNSLNLTLLIVAGLACSGIIAVYLLVDSPAQEWLSLIKDELIPMLEQAGMQFPAAQQSEQQLQFMAQIMTGSAAGLFFIGQALAVLLGRWWQSLLYRPGAFAEEYQQLRSGSAIAGLSLLIVLLVVTTKAELAVNLLFVVVALYVLQGLAVLHRLVNKCQVGSAWLVGGYVIMFFTFPYGPVLFACVGMFDNWINFRVRFCNAAVQDRSN